VEYNVKLDKIYEGPANVLYEHIKNVDGCGAEGECSVPIAVLYELIKAQKIDIYDIPISRITEQYLEYLKFLSIMDIEISAEFILMASTLMFIKSRMLLPLESVGEDGERQDPRRELIEKLLEYQKFKEAAQCLEESEIAQKDLIFREKQQYLFDYKDEENWIDISIYDLINAIAMIADAVNQPDFSQLAPESLTVAMKIEEITKRLEEFDRFYFAEVFSDPVTKFEIVVTFLAILEMVKNNLICIQQHKLFGDIRIVKRTA
jgi:segregation and condensation protein A